MAPKKVAKIKARKKVASSKKATKAQKPSPWHIPLVPLSSWILFWAFVLTAIILSAACFTSGFRPMQQEVDQEAVAMLEAVKNSLEQQVEELEGKVEDQNTQQIATQTAPCNTGALLVDEVSLNYSDQDSGVKMTLPYSSYEDQNGCVISTVEKTTDGAIAFGPFVGTEGGSDQDSFIRILPVTSTSAILNELKGRTSDPENPVTNIRQRLISGLTVISHEETWAIGGGARYWYAIGRNFSYEIGSLGWLTDAEAVKIIQSLRVTK